MSYFPHAFQKMLSATHPLGGATPLPFSNTTSATPNATINITAGQVAVVNALNNTPIDLSVTPVYGPSGTANNYSQVYLAQGSYHNLDKIGPFHGGYKETVKSKGINAKLVSSFYRTDPSNPVNDVLEIAQVNCGLDCDTMYDLRLDIKGSPALRFLNHNLYQTLSAYTGCCTVTSGVNDKVDPTVVLLQWADLINNTTATAGFSPSGNNSIPFLNQFVQALVYVKTALATTATGTAATSTITVASAGAGATAIQVGNKVKYTIGTTTYVAYVKSTYVAASTSVPLVNADGTDFVIPVALSATNIKVYRTTTTAAYTPATGASAITVDSNIDIIGAYVDTVFGDCSFDPKDHFETEPIQLYASMAAYANNSNDLGGDTCAVSCFTVTETQAAKQGKGFGETLVRELILAKRYQQEPWYADPRMREVMNDTTLGTSGGGGPEIVRGTKYSVYYLLHSIPRKNNPSGLYDQDQYLVKIVVPWFTSNTTITPAATVTNMTVFQTWWNTWLTSAQSGVTLQVLV